MTDTLILSGLTHRCACGSIWTDSDGESCHKACIDCGNIVHLQELDDHCRCTECHKEKCKECGDAVKPEDLINGICEYCLTFVEEK